MMQALRIKSRGWSTKTGNVVSVTALATALGFSHQDRIVIIVCDGLGSSNAANIGVVEGLRNGVATTACLQVPSPWARGAAAQHKGDDVGVDLTCISEYDLYRWGPITSAPSLLDGDGGFPRTVLDLGEHADVDELHRECVAQLERAILWGFDPTHLGSHFDALSSRPEFFSVLLDLAVEYNLPLSLPDPSTDLGFPARELAKNEGLLVPDYVVRSPIRTESRGTVDTALRTLRAGVTEIHVRPAVDTPELRAISDRWQTQVSDHHLITQDWGFRAALDRSGAKLTSFRALRTAQRN